MTSKFESILFDLDGTLFDTADDLGASLNFVLNKYGLPKVGQNAYTMVASDGSKGLLEVGFGDQLDNYDFTELQKQFLDHYHANNCVKTTLFAGISDLLNELSKHDITWGVVTNKPEFLTTPLLAQFSEFKGSKVDISGDTLPQRKPNPEPLLHAARIVKCEPTKSLYVGDHLRDIQAGNDAGMTTAVAGWGYIKPTDDVTAWQPNHICDDVEALRKLIFATD